MTRAPLLYVHVYRRQWNLVVERAATFPEEACFQDGEGCTPLHMACYGIDPPASVVSCLLKVHPGAVTIKNRWGRTPLHIAALSSSPHVVRMLLEVEGGVGAVYIRGTQFETLYTTPLENLCVRHGRRICDKINRLSLLSNDDVDKAFDSMVQYDDRFQEVWSKACLLVKAEAYGKVPKDLHPESLYRNIVHACAASTQCPHALLLLAASMFPCQLRKTDSNGNLPLHLAASASSTLSCKGDWEKRKKFMALVTGYPTAAKVRNRNGKLPLHLAVESGKRWEEGINDIFNAFPDAVRMRDKATALYPFMTCATFDDRKHEQSTLSSVYRLLQSCPELDAFVG